MKNETCAFCHRSLIDREVADKLGLNNTVNRQRTCSRECHSLCMAIQALLGKRRVGSFCDFYGNETVHYA